MSLAVTLLLMSASEAMAQRRRTLTFRNLQEHDQKPYNFGFSLGLNTINFALTPIEGLQDEYKLEYTLPQQDFGFHIGIVSNLKLNRYMDLRFIPAISFGDRYIEYYEGLFEDGPTKRQDLETTVMEFPLHLKYKSARMMNTRVYVIAGGKYTHDLASIELGVGDEIYARVARNDIHYELGAGYEYYFHYFKFSAEIKASFGILNLARPGEKGARYYDSIDRLNSKSLMFSLMFE